MKTGHDLLRDALLNRGTAYTADERLRLGLTGLLPPSVETIDVQVRRVLDQVYARHSNLEKYLHLSAVQDENETLFYRTLTQHLEELLPFAYTPTVGEACLQWSHLYLRPRGLYLSGRERGRFVAVPIAAAVAQVAYEHDLATGPRPADVAAFIGMRRYAPAYPQESLGEELEPTPA